MLGEGAGGEPETLPDVLAELIAAGGTTMPMTAALGEPRPGDDDLKVIIVRRSTLEWVLRKAVAAQDHVRVRTGAGVTGLLSDGTDEVVASFSASGGRTVASISVAPAG